LASNTCTPVIACESDAGTMVTPTVSGAPAVAEDFFSADRTANR
jgi:hypothetical protein